ncbi:cholecystokinin [Colossoma macropomum]|uniref:cholecystokinin n=1 Tax=Colossoma macropomum TaxID=42526 RepID=UPI0018640198|nr:cholecystokinin [Colossoma macropomum]
MYGAVGVCVLLVSLSVSCLARPRSSLPQDGGDVLPSQMEAGLRVSRSDSPLKTQPVPDDQGDPRANLSELLARLISRKGSVRRNSTVNSKAGSLTANHRIKDRDYLGWMDFGRRSAEEYEYSS